MASRGRGYRSTTLTKEQLQTLGCVGNDKNMPVLTTPPPTFPTLLNKPYPIKDLDYSIEWKHRFMDRMQKSFHNLPELSYHHQKEPLQNERDKPKAEITFNKHMMPKELFIRSKKRKTIILPSQQQKPKKPNFENIDERLKLLEEKEKLEPETDKKGNKSDSDNEEEENLDGDDEMDDENDYGNSYFDNGEGYHEEDDNLDDGPVY